MYGEDGVTSMNNQKIDEESAKVNSQRNIAIKQDAASRITADDKKKNQKRKKMSQAAKNNPKYTENWLPIREIRSGAIYNDKNEIITGVRIEPKNIFLLDESQIFNTLGGLNNLYNTIGFEFWMIVADRPVDLTVYQSELQMLYNKAQDNKIRKLIAQDIEKAEGFINNDVVDTEYYLLFKDKAPDMVQKKIRQLINGFSAAGMTTSQTTNEDLRMIIDNFMNGGKNYNSGTVIIE